MDILRINEVIKNALLEDIGKGDITTSAIVSEGVSAGGEFLVKQDGVIAGLDILEILFRQVNPELKFIKCVSDGDRINSGQIAASIEGSAASILSAERTALNFLQRMSGIATLTQLFVEKIKHTHARILDTRKTAPGLRELDKLAVKIGGGTNHRIGLFDMFLIKDNHIAVAGSITKAVERCKEFRDRRKSFNKIEVETTNIMQVKEALNCNVDFIMLDNFELDDMKEAVKLINRTCLIEASGGIDLNTVKFIAETGVDYISIGALTHSVKALDISLEITPQK
jgi:nicotinate-nucleotide pyrophosphorylase (carboxylating)